VEDERKRKRRTRETDPKEVSHCGGGGGEDVHKEKIRRNITMRVEGRAREFKRDAQEREKQIDIQRLRETL
jgi:hypothetical protein